MRALAVHIKIALAALVTLNIAKAASAPTGQAAYEHYCAQCHGIQGDGNGPAAVWLYPKPRNFNAGLFKIQSSPGGFLPTDEDLFRTITRGLPGTAMPGFSFLSETQRMELVQYVKHLTSYVDESGRRINRFEQAKAAGQQPVAVTVPPEPPVTMQTLALGKEIFNKLQCYTCHGATGAGDGERVPTLRDAFGLPIRPRDFNTGAFLGGHTGRDLYLRINNGLAGTPMAAFGEGVISANERWALVHYVLSLRRKEIEINDILAPADNIIHAKRVKQRLPDDPLDGFWDSLDPVRIPLNPLWSEPHPVPAVAVTAIHDGKRIMFLCQWRDETINDLALRPQDFQDAVAIQFSMTDATPFLGMGEAAYQVNIWQWKAGWQRDINYRRNDMHAIYPSMHVDTYLNANDLYNTATVAGNIVSIYHQSPVEDANARGFGTFSAQPPAAQNVGGRGVWHDGFWNVILFRDIKSKDKDDVNLATRRAIPVAFAVWDGQQSHRNGRKVVSNWYKLVLE